MNDVNIFDADLMDAEKDEEVLDSFHGIFLYIDGGIRFSSSTSTFFYTWKPVLLSTLLASCSSTFKNWLLPKSI